jgi:DNA mismatch endonuclease (patch repair protein)
MSDVFIVEERSRIMARIRSSGNKSTRFIQLLKRHRITGWRRGSRLPRRPDFVFPERRVAVFVDGDVWHGNPASFRSPKSNIRYWAKKIGSNRRRDRSVNRELRVGTGCIHRAHRRGLFSG